MGWLDALRDLGGALSEVTERWVPDAWVICMMLTAVALALTLFGAGAGLEETVLAWGAGVWNLLELAMQFTIALVAAHACVASRPVHRTLDLPGTSRLRWSDSQVSPDVGVAPPALVLFDVWEDAENITNRTVKAPPKAGQNAAPGGISRPQLALRGTSLEP